MIMGGWIVDIDVDLCSDYMIYVVVGSGGFWKIMNNGIIWCCIFENEGMMLIGDIVIDLL